MDDGITTRYQCLVCSAHHLLTDEQLEDHRWCGTCGDSLGLAIVEVAPWENLSAEG